MAIKSLTEHIHEKLAAAQGGGYAKFAHVSALDEAAEERAVEMLKLAQELAEGGQELEFDDVMELVNPDGENFLEGLVTEMAMAKIEDAANE